jgi:hypothetical protein
VKVGEELGEGLRGNAVTYLKKQDDDDYDDDDDIMPNTLNNQTLLGWTL